MVDSTSLTFYVNEMHATDLEFSDDDHESPPFLICLRDKTKCGFSDEVEKPNY